jgi:pyruvate carboxylase subunit B
LIYSGQCIVDAGLKHEMTITMMALPPGCSGAHDPEFYKKVLQSILDAKIPFHSLCFKDASGTSTPTTVYETIKIAKSMLPPEIEIKFHTHETAGISVICHKAALDAGADGIDLAMAPVSGGTSHPDIVTMWHALRGTDYDLGLDIEKILKAEEVFKDCMKDYFMPPEAAKVEPIIPFSPLPGGALTANTQMLRDNGIMDKFQDVIKEMGEVVRKGGFGTSVTPVAQFYFQQAFNNIMFGRWEKIAEGYGKMVLGYFGKTPCAPDSEIIKIASEQLKLAPTTELPIDLNDKNPNKGVAASKKMLEEAGLPTTDENIFIAGSCKEKGIDFLLGKAKNMVRKIDVAPKKEEAKSTNNSWTVSINNKNYSVVLDGNKAKVNGKDYSFDIKEGINASTEIKANTLSSTGESIQAPLPGVIVKISVNVGDNIEEGQTILAMEAMKMETEIKAKKAGVISEILVAKGDRVKKGQDLVRM